MPYFEVCIYNDNTDDENKINIIFQHQETAYIIADYINNGYKCSSDPISDLFTIKEQKLIKAYEDRYHNYNEQHGINKASVFTETFFEDLAYFDSE